MHRRSPLFRIRTFLSEHLAESQHRNAYYLTGNALLGAATGLLFWLLISRVLGIVPGAVGIGYAIISMGTILGVVGKGGLDTALIRNVPQTEPRDGRRLLRFGILIGVAAAAVLGVALALVLGLTGAMEEMGAAGWLLAISIGALLVVTWLQDAYFIAEKDAKATFQRNLVFSASRLLLPIPLVLWFEPVAVALAWAASLAVSATVAMFIHRPVPREGVDVPRRRFLGSAMRNVTGSAAEFLPGLLLVPVVLAASGAEAAGFFGIAWTAASLLFLVSAAVSRSALTEMVRGEQQLRDAVRRGTRHLVGIVAPGAVVAFVLAPYLMGIFGSAYAAAATDVFRILVASTLFVAPAYLYLAILRAREHPRVLVLFPLAMVVAILVFTPLLAAHFGLLGAGIAWLLANIPFGLWGGYRLRQEAREVKTPNVAPTHRRAPHAE